MKNKTTPIIVVVVVVLLIIAGAYYVMHKHSAMISGQAANPLGQSQASPQKKSLFDFFSLAGSQKCTFSDSTSKSAGTVYVSSGKMRGDFQETNNSTGQTQQTHMINDGNYVYIWTDGQSSGYKMSEAAIKQEESQPTASPANRTTGTQSSQPVDMNQKANYSCGSWSPDASYFVPPTNVNFTDYSSVAQGTSTGTAAQKGSVPAGGNQAACAECNQAPAGAARNQCLTALHCQ